MREHVVRLSVQMVGEPETGEWCPLCALPSAVRFLFIVTGPGLSYPIDVACCQECAWEETVDLRGPMDG